MKVEYADGSMINWFMVLNDIIKAKLVKKKGKEVFTIFINSISNSMTV